MRLLFTIDTGDYDLSRPGIVRDAARSIIINEGKIALVHSLKYDYYKFPGGGIEAEEDKLEALKRETVEEAGLVIKPETVREFGYVHRIQKGFSENDGYFKQDNFYYLCEVEKGTTDQALDAYEADESFTLEYVDPRVAIRANRQKDHGPKDKNMIEREARVLEILILEGYFN